MKKFFGIIIAFLALAIVVGCENQETILLPVDSMESPQETTPEESTFSHTEETYTSINEYSNYINGESFKTGLLNIRIKENVVYLEMNVSISPELKEKMLNTKENFYFHFADVTGNSIISKLMVETPQPILGDLEKLRDGEYFSLSQQFTLHPDISDKELQKVSSPENYELQILNEERILVAVTIGLDINMIID